MEFFFILGIVAFQSAFLVAAAAVNRMALNPDGVAYIRIASYLVSGSDELMVSGYWGPLFSGLIAPFLALGLAPLLAARFAMAISAVVFVLSVRAVLRSFEVPSLVVIAGSAIAAVWSIAWSVIFITPDLLLAGVMCFAIAMTVSRSWTSSRRWQIGTGLVWGVAYLTKAVAFPVMLMMTVAFAMLHVDARSLRYRSSTMALLITWLGFVVVAAPWMLTLSLEYGRPTFSTTSRIAHGIVGPPTVDRFHPSFTTLHQPEAGRIFSWEDPSRMPYQFWSPFENAEYARHQFEVIRTNVMATVEVLRGFATFSAALVALFLSLPPPWNWRAAIREKWRWVAVPILCLVAVYLPVHAGEERYLYPIYPLFLVAAFGVVSWLSRLTPTRIVRLLIGSLMILLFAIPAFENAAAAMRGFPSEGSEMAHFLADRIPPSMAGPVVGGSASAWHTGIYLAFLIDQPWYGDEKPADPERFHESGARLVMLKRDAADLPRFESSSFFQDLDPLLFSSAAEAEEFPVKLFHSPGAIPLRSSDVGAFEAASP